MSGLHLSAGEAGRERGSGGGVIYNTINKKISFVLLP